MQKHSSKSKDVNVNAFNVVAQATGTDKPKPQDEGKNPAAVALGRLGGKVGGKRRAEKLTPEQRKEIAQKAAKARWQSNQD